MMAVTVSKQRRSELVDLGKLQRVHPLSSHPPLVSPFHLISHVSSTATPCSSQAPLSCRSAPSLSLTLCLCPDASPGDSPVATCPLTLPAQLRRHLGNSYSHLSSISIATSVICNTLTTIFFFNTSLYSVRVSAIQETC